jgi:hypothetical protein
MRMRTLLPVLAVLLCAEPAVAAESFSEAFTQGKFNLDFRYRYEWVDQDAYAEDARASTLRGRVNFETDPWNNFTAFGEFDYVTDVIWDDYNAGAGNTPDKIQYPIVADPTGPDLNQLYLDWTNARGTKLRGGRQKIILDNQRFVGAVGFRQNEQTFDAGWFNHKLGNFEFKLGYVWQVNRIFGDDVPAGTDDSATWLAHLSREWEGRGKLSVYYYDIDDKDVPTFSSLSVGARWAGTTEFSSKPVKYTLEYAHQSDVHNQPVDYSANYYRADITVEFDKLSPTIGIESLGGDDDRPGASFRTPLATLHAFNGWADKFLTTPAAGLDDFFVGLKGPLGPWTWNVVYHDFDAESGGSSYGDEFDVSFTRDIGERYGVYLAAAWFDGVGGPVFDDTAKVWLAFTADF